MDIIDFHIKSNYFVKVSQLKTENVEGCIVEYPKDKLSNNVLGRDKYVYIMTNGGMECYVNDKLERDLTCPSYCKRLIVLGDVLCKCSNRGVSSELLVFYDVDGNNLGKIKFVDLFSVPDDVRREEELSSLYYDIVLLKNMEEEAKQAGVVDGYKVLRDLFLKKGIYR